MPGLNNGVVFNRGCPTQMQEILLEFRAGKMVFEGKRVAPDTRKGLVRIARPFSKSIFFLYQGDERLVHFQWLDRSLNVVEDIIFPDEAVFEKVNHASGRVYILKFNTDDRKSVFWMQEPKAEGDSQLCNSVNYYLNRPLEFVDEEGPDGSVPLQVSEDMVEDDLSSRAAILQEPDLGGEVSSDVTSSSGPVKLADLQRILSNIEPADRAVDPDEGVSLEDILKPELIMPLIETLPLEQGLGSYLPEDQWSPEDISDSVAKTSESEESRQDSTDLKSESCNRNDPMDESK